MQHPAYDTHIARFWNGTSDFSAHLLSNSAIFALFWRAPATQAQDYEKNLRTEAFTFRRANLKNYAPHRLSYTGIYEPMGLRFNIEAFIIFIWVNYAISINLSIYDVVKTMVGAMKEMGGLTGIMAMMANMMSGSMGGMSGDSMSTGGMSGGSMSSGDMSSMGGGMASGMSGMAGGMGGGMQMPPMLMGMMENAPFIYNELEKVMYMYSATIILPIIYFQKYLHTRQTRQEFNFTPSFVSTQLLFISWVWTFAKWKSLRDEVNTGFGMPMPSKEVMFLNALVVDMNNRLDNLPTLISLICCFTWLSLLAALTRT